MRDPRRHTIALDFDGVIHAYRDGWRGGEIYDELTDGCGDALRELHKRSKLVICTCRHDLDAVHTYLMDRGIRQFFESIDNRKPVASLYPDDRGLRFTGDWDEVLRAAASL